MHRPRLVILDEPTAGVDFELRQELWSYIRQLHAEGTTILLTTHYLEEAEELCEEIALIRDGRLIARDSADGPARDFGAGRLADVYVKAMAGVEHGARGPAPALARRARDAARLEAVDPDRARAGGLLAALHRRVRALAGRPDAQVGGVDHEIVHRARA